MFNKNMQEVYTRLESIELGIEKCKYRIKWLEDYIHRHINKYTGDKETVSREEFNALLEHLFVELEKVPAEPSKFVVKEKGE